MRLPEPRSWSDPDALRAYVAESADPLIEALDRARPYLDEDAQSRAWMVVAERIAAGLVGRDTIIGLPGG